MKPDQKRAGEGCYSIFSALSYTPTPLCSIENETTRSAGVQLYIKREDMNHPFVSGNKWWKLKYNLLQAKKEHHTKILTFGGAYSNHIYSTAVAARKTNLESIGVIRGEKVRPLNNILSFACRQGMRLHFIDRETYRNKLESYVLNALKKQFGRFYLVPEGGTNALAVKGCREWAGQLSNELDFDCLCISVGTGGTLAGLVEGMAKKRIIGFSALKGGAFLYHEVKKRITIDPMNWHIETAYHFGGYGKKDEVLERFIKDFEDRHGIPLDSVYTGKMMCGLHDLIHRGFFKRGVRILALHTGGLQGKRERIYPNKS